MGRSVGRVQDDIFFGRDMLQELSFFLVLLTAGLGEAKSSCVRSLWSGVEWSSRMLSISWMGGDM